MTIEEIVHGESQNVEFKVTLPKDSEKYTKSTVAFANTQGGKLIFGIDDKTREVAGIDEDELFKMMDSISNAVSDSCELRIRNRAIANIFNKMGFVESWGTGMKRILDGARRYGLPMPDIQVFDDMFRVNLFRNAFPLEEQEGIGEASEKLQRNSGETLEKYQGGIGEASEKHWRSIGVIPEMI